MSKVPQRDEIWQHKENGYLARIIHVDKFCVFFYDNQDGCNSIDDMDNACDRDAFENDFVFIGQGKPLDILFEVYNE